MSKISNWLLEQQEARQAILDIDTTVTQSNKVQDTTLYDTFKGLRDNKVPLKEQNFIMKDDINDCS